MRSNLLGQVGSMAFGTCGVVSSQNGGRSIDLCRLESSSIPVRGIGRLKCLMAANASEWVVQNARLEPVLSVVESHLFILKGWIR